MGTLKTAFISLKSLFRGSADDTDESLIGAALPEAYPLNTFMNTSAQDNHPPHHVQSIIMIGAFHDGHGDMYKDDVQLLKNTVTYLEQSGIHVAPDARVLPMTLRQGEDIMEVQPQADMAIICYVYDDRVDKYSDKPNSSFWAQSSKIKGHSEDERYAAWQSALDNTGAGIVFSLGHPEEISVKKTDSDDYMLVIDPQDLTDELPPMLTKMKHKQKSYGLSVRKDIMPSISQSATQETALGRVLVNSLGHNEFPAI